MRIVSFNYETDAQGSIVYPDNISLFKNTELLLGSTPLQVYGEYYGSDESIPTLVDPPAPDRDWETIEPWASVS